MANQTTDTYLWWVEWGNHSGTGFVDIDKARAHAIANNGRIREISARVYEDHTDPRCKAIRVGQRCIASVLWPNSAQIHSGSHVAWRIKTTGDTEYIIWPHDTTSELSYRQLSTVDYESIKAALAAQSEREEPF